MIQTTMTNTNTSKNTKVTNTILTTMNYSALFPSWYIYWADGPWPLSNRQTQFAHYGK